MDPEYHCSLLSISLLLNKIEGMTVTGFQPQWLPDDLASHLLGPLSCQKTF
tara:strand:+ start:322 stop:474 length:153 start_codon:yes stop_codon:yes gene_type:complete